VLANGDVLVAESNQVAGPTRSLFSYAMQATMRRARASASARTASRCCAMRMATASPKSAKFLWSD
jgi:hypothetical protein